MWGLTSDKMGVIVQIEQMAFRGDVVQIYSILFSTVRF